MRKTLAQVYQWICPPSPLGNEYTIPEIRRRFITHYILILNSIFIIALYVIKSMIIQQPIFETVLYGVGSYFCIIFLCHWRQALIAAMFYTVSMFLTTIYFTHQVALIRHSFSVSELVVVFFIPIWCAGAFLDFRGLWTALGGLSIIFFINSVTGHAIFLTDTSYPFQVLILLTAVALILSLGIFTFRRVLKESDHSQELIDLNEILERSIQDKEIILNEFGTVFESVQDALIVFNQHGELVHQNAAFTRAFSGIVSGQPMEEFLQCVPCTTLNHMPVTLFDFPAYKIMHGENGTPTLRVRIQKNTTDLSIMDIQAVPLFSKPDELFGVLTVLRDITQEYRNTFNLEVLRQVSHACITGIAVQTVADAALTAVCDGLRITYGLIALHDADIDTRATIIANRTHFNFDMFSPGDFNISAESPFQFLQVMSLGEARYNIDPNCFSKESTTEQIKQRLERAGMMCCFPLQCNGNILGVLEVMRAEGDFTPWDEPDCMLLTMITDEVAISLHRAQLYEEARLLAMYDPLTGLYNHRTMQSQLSATLENMHDLEDATSVIMLDIDHFRRFNELYGHNIGDAALKHVAHAIQRSLRTGDIGARYGGEEFTIILPDTESREAGIVAERVRQAITQISFNNPLVKDKMLSVTASLGYATSNLQHKTPAALLKAADIALYAAKHAGRNCVVEFKQKETITLEASERDIMIPETKYDIEAIQALITAIDLRDGFTSAHSEQVAQYSVAIGRELKLPQGDIERLRLGGLIHDIGKIGVPHDLISTARTLTLKELQVIQSHTTIGEEIILPVHELHDLIPFVRWHHERLDGTGYPDGLVGANIPLLVQIVAVANVFESYTAERPYHSARPVIEGLEYLRKEAAAGRIDITLVEILSDIVFSSLMSHTPSQAA